MIRRPPRSTRVRSSAASDVYKRQVIGLSVTPTGSLVARRVPFRHTAGPQRMLPSPMSAGVGGGDAVFDGDSQRGNDSGRSGDFSGPSPSTAHHFFQCDAFLRLESQREGHALSGKFPAARFARPGGSGVGELGDDVLAMVLTGPGDDLGVGRSLDECAEQVVHHGVVERFQDPHGNECRTGAVLGAPTGGSPTGPPHDSLCGFSSRLSRFPVSYTHLTLPTILRV